MELEVKMRGFTETVNITTDHPLANPGQPVMLNAYGEIYDWQTPGVADMELLTEGAEAEDVYDKWARCMLRLAKQWEDVN